MQSPCQHDVGDTGRPKEHKLIAIGIAGASRVRPRLTRVLPLATRPTIWTEPEASLPNDVKDAGQGPRPGNSPKTLALGRRSCPSS